MTLRILNYFLRKVFGCPSFPLVFSKCNSCLVKTLRKDERNLFIIQDIIIDNLFLKVEITCNLIELWSFYWSVSFNRCNHFTVIVIVSVDWNETLVGRSGRLSLTTYRSLESRSIFRRNSVNLKLKVDQFFVDNIIPTNR